jgi:hypothetical protein
VIPRPLATAIIMIVTLVWAVNFGAQFIVDSYEPDVAINGIFMAIVGGALALSRRDNKGAKNAEEKDEAVISDESPKAE